MKNIGLIFFTARFFNHLMVGLVTIVMVACVESAGKTVESTAITGSSDTIPVTTATATLKTFNRELLCNGVVQAEGVAQVSFELQGTIAKVLVKNGDRVERGALLALLDDRELRAAFDQAKVRLEKAELERDDYLLGFASNFADTASLSSSILKVARVRSGYSEALLSLRESQRKLDQASLRAPVAGTVVDLEAHSNNPTNSYPYLCRIVEDRTLCVVFQVLETELDMATKGAAVVLSPYSNQGIQVMGVVTDVNPVVDASGMIKIRAAIKGASPELLMGMNVKVRVLHPFPNKLVVPKQAVVMRQGKPVIFTYEGGLAKWNYVTLGAQNSNEAIITGGIKVGAEAIITGNVTIGHDAKVVKVNT